MLAFRNLTGGLLTSPHLSFRHFLILPELLGRLQVIEFPIVVLDARSGELVAEFHAYVRPLLNPRLTPFCTQLTGIEQATVDAAEPFPAVFARAQEFYKRFHSQHGAGVRTMFVTCGDWDLQTMLPAQARLSGLQVPSYLQRWINVKVPFRRCLAALGGGASGGGGLGMAGMLEQLGLPLVGRHHSGIDDARNIAYIVRELLRRGQVLDKTTEWSASLKRELG